MLTSLSAPLSRTNRRNSQTIQHFISMGKKNMDALLSNIMGEAIERPAEDSTPETTQQEKAPLPSKEKAKDIHLRHVGWQTSSLSVTLKKVRGKETLLCLCHWIGIEVQKSNKMESIRLTVQSKVHIIEHSLFFTYCPVTAKHVNLVVYPTITLHHNRFINLQPLWFCLL